MRGNVCKSGLPCTHPPTPTHHDKQDLVANSAGLYGRSKCQWAGNLHATNLFKLKQNKAIGALLDYQRPTADIENVPHAKYSTQCNICAASKDKHKANGKTRSSQRKKNKKFEKSVCLCVCLCSKTTSALCCVLCVCVYVEDVEDVALQHRVADICIFLCTALQSFPLCSLLSLVYFGAAQTPAMMP